MKFFFLIFLLILNSNVTHQESCTLPGGTQLSTCEKLYDCIYFRDILRKYNGRPPSKVVDNINTHKCRNSGLVCCPDNAKIAQIPAPQELNIKSSKEIDYNAIKNHRNINLINAKTCGPISSERIVNGDNAKVREFRWAALLGLQSAGQINWSCGGTLISQRYVLTVCHCVSTDLVKVRLGEHTISSKIDCDDSDQCADPVQDIDIERKIKHPHFKRSTRENDIALVRLARPADLTKNNVKTICLPTNPKSDIEEFQKLGLNLTVTGWGLTQGGKPSDILQRALVPYIDFNKCNAIFNSDGLKVYPTQLCAGYSKNSGHSKTDSCKGDSGGGLIGNFLYNEYPKAILYGVVVGGVNCLDPTKIYPGIYTNVKYFLTWILDNMDE